MNPQGVQPVSGWQGMQQPNLSIAPEAGSVPAAQQFQVDQSPTVGQIKPGGSPNLGAMSSLAMLAMLA